MTAVNSWLENQCNINKETGPRESFIDQFLTFSCQSSISQSRPGQSPVLAGPKVWNEPLFWSGRSRPHRSVSNYHLFLSVEVINDDFSIPEHCSITHDFQRSKTILCASKGLATSFSSRWSKMLLAEFARLVDRKMSQITVFLGSVRTAQIPSPRTFTGTPV